MMFKRIRTQLCEKMIASEHSKKFDEKNRWGKQWKHRANHPSECIIENTRSGGMLLQNPLPSPTLLEAVSIAGESAPRQ